MGGSSSFPSQVMIERAAAGRLPGDHHLHPVAGEQAQRGIVDGRPQHRLHTAQVQDHPAGAFTGWSQRNPAFGQTRLRHLIGHHRQHCSESRRQQRCQWPHQPASAQHQHA